MNIQGRRFRLFPRTLAEVVKHATQPMFDKQGKLFGAILRDWSSIVGERANVTRPQRMQFGTKQEGGTLYVDTTPSMAPELSYITEQMIEQCNRYFGYRAVARIVFNPVHGLFTESSVTPTTKPPSLQAQLPESLPRELKEIFARMAKKPE